ncbi:MAG: glycosyltransferase [Bacteroidales bacterium]|nr:glycosyltransferase [Bacteroidales bacterium]
MSDKYIKQNDNIIVSICCITYNHAPYIRQCLDGFIMQKTTFPIEILIHDDASTDGTEEIIREYEVKYPHIIKPLYEVENQWVKGRRGSATFNFPRARGKYIALCEGDDYWTDPLKLQKQVEFLENNSEYVLVHTDIKILYERSGKIISTNDKQINSQLSKNISFQELLLSGKYIIRTATVLFKKSILADSINNNKFLFSNNFLMGDTPLWYSLSKYGSFKFLSDCTTIYRRHFNSATNGPIKKKLRFNLSMYELRFYITNNDDSFTEEFKKKIVGKYREKLYEYLLFESRYEPMFKINLDNKSKFNKSIDKLYIIAKYYLLRILYKVFMPSKSL